MGAKKAGGFEIENQPSFPCEFTANSSPYVLIGWLVTRIAGGERQRWIKAIHSLAAGPTEAFSTIRTFRRNSTTFDSVRGRSYWTNRIMGVCPVVWEMKVGPSVWWEVTRTGILSSSVSRGREILVGRD